jgi:hypothetical protein
LLALCSADALAANRSRPTVPPLHQQLPAALPLAYQWYFSPTNQDDPKNWYDIPDDDRIGF